MRNQPLLLVPIFFLFVLQLFSQSTPTVDSAAITQLLYQQVRDDSPGMAVGIVKDGKIVYEQYLGYANLEHEIPIDQDTRFNIASNAKQFTALCILQLQEEGKLDLEDDMRRYLPDFYPTIEDKITISNLLTHTSGIRDYCDLMALTGKTWWKQFIDNGDALELLRAQQDLNYVPGTAFLYSNSNYILLTEIVKQVSGQNFSEYATSLFDTLGMPNTRFLTNYTEIIPHKARPYGNWGGWREEPTITEVHGDGALYTNLRDQLRWEQILQTHEGTHFSPAFLQESQSPLASSIEGGYGYGLFFDTYQERAYAWHDGVTGANRATFVRFPSENLSIVLMSNNRNVGLDRVAWQIIPRLLGGEEATPTYPGGPEKVEALASLEEVLGNYQKEDGTIIRITEKDGALYRELYQRDPVQLLPEQGGLFEYETIPGLKMNFTKMGTPEQQFTIYLSSQPPSTYHKISDLHLDRFDKRELNGRFFNEETKTEIILAHVEGNTYSLTKNGRERTAELLLADYVRMMDSYEIKVIRDEAGQVVGLSVDGNRIRQVRFDKR